MNEELHLPWDREGLKNLLIRVVQTGESTKVDLKKEFNLSDNHHKAELLKDVSAFANTYWHHYKNHGFIVFGATRNNISYTTFPNNEDHLQATIDDLVTKYIGPFITCQLFIFEENTQQWGVLVVPPTGNAPHVFIKDIHDRNRGEIYVRNGTTTEKAQPEDYARFFRQHLEEHTYSFHQSISDLQDQMSKLESKFKKIRTVSHKGLRQLDNTKAKTDIAQSEELEGQPLNEIIDTVLAKEDDIIAQSLFKEVKKIISFLESEEISWSLNNSEKKQSEEILTKIESSTREFWLAIISIISRDEKGTYDKTILKTITLLARRIEPPSGTTFTEWGVNIRFYPLFVSIYLITIISVAKKRNKLLKEIFKIELHGRSHYTEPLPITYILFLIRQAEGIFHPLYEGYPQRKWCDPVATYTKLLVEKILIVNDTLWEKEREFFIGEFVLCIAPIDIIEKVSNKPMIGHPSSGLFIFISSTIPIITRFLKQEHDWLQKIFERPLKEILSEFDQTASKLARSPGCWCDGFASGALEAAFPEKKS